MKRTKICDVGSGKRTKRIMPLSEKVAILDKLRIGMTPTSVGREYGVNESTIRTIRSAEERIREMARLNNPEFTGCRKVPRSSLAMIKMEKLLVAWLDVQTKDNEVEVDNSAVREKARELYQKVIESEDEVVNKCFQASKGWLLNFRKRYRNGNYKFDNENSHFTTEHDLSETNEHFDEESDSSKTRVDTNYNCEFLEAVKKRNYCADQIFTASELQFYSKINQNGAQKLMLSKDDEMTLLLCTNASGEYKCKPLIVCRHSDPKSLQGKTRFHLPVVYSSNATGRMSPSLFEDWVNNNFVHEVKEFLLKRSLEFKVLLVLKNNPYLISETLLFAHQFVEICVLPSDHIHSVLPMELGIENLFKLQYTLYMLDQVNDQLGGPQKLEDFNSNYCTRNIIEVIHKAWKTINPIVINSYWCNLWPEIAKNFTGFFPNCPDELDVINSLRQLGIQTEEEDVTALLNSHCEDEFFEPSPVVEILASRQGDTVKPIVYLESLKQFMKMSEELQNMAVNIDPIMERSLKFKDGMEEILAPYKQLLEDMLRRERRLSETIIQSSSNDDFLKTGHGYNAERMVTVKEEVHE